ncbi:MAG: sigma-54-dependent transcriptional regulator [Syntrophobacteraceae bacterium]
MADVLIIDDDRTVCSMLSRILENIGYGATHAHTLEEGLREVLSKSYDVVFLDVGLPDGNGLDALPKILETGSSPEVVIITGAGDPDGAELAIRSGAWDYLQKPLSPETVILPLKRVLQYRDGLKKAQKPPVSLKREGIVGNSPTIKACLDLVAQAAGSESNVLISGETGTGKELFARAIHDNSPRAERLFVTVDCTAIPDTLVESTLLGHEKGAFTGADRTQEGLIKQADGGTLFLDEVGELPLSLQKAFLRVLQERRFRPLGGKKEIASDFRLIAATNRDLESMVNQGQFRKDLLYRLCTLSIQLPPLRERRDDIKELVQHYANQLCERYRIASKGFSPDFFDILAAYDWPGNVRELVNTVETVLTVGRHEPTIFPKHLPTDIRIKLARASVEGPAPGPSSSISGTNVYECFPNLEGLLERTERQYLMDLVSLTEGNVPELCRISGLSRSRLYARLKKYNIVRRF